MSVLFVFCFHFSVTHVVKLSMVVPSHLSTSLPFQFLILSIPIFGIQWHWSLIDLDQITYKWHDLVQIVSSLSCISFLAYKIKLIITATNLRELRIRYNMQIVYSTVQLMRVVSIIFGIRKLSHK